MKELRRLLFTFYVCVCAFAYTCVCVTVVCVSAKHCLVPASQMQRLAAFVCFCYCE